MGREKVAAGERRGVQWRGGRGERAEKTWAQGCADFLSLSF
jgi:hypothetical protein